MVALALAACAVFGTTGSLASATATRVTGVDPVQLVVAYEVDMITPVRVGTLPVDVKIRAIGADGATVTDFHGQAQVEGIRDAEGHPTKTVEVVAGVATLRRVHVDDVVEVRTAGDPGRRVSRLPISTHWIPGVLALVPALFAIFLAVVLKQAMVALFAGIWLGATFVYEWNPAKALLRVFDTHLVDALADSDRAAIVLFTMALGGMVGILARSGATKALVEALSKGRRSRRSGMVIGWISGVVIFFDDYANCLLVGNALRPYTDRLRISREKLSYIVDSTAAPVTTIAIVSTWVGYQLELLEGLGPNPYDIFISSLPYSFYSLITLWFVLVNAVSQRDFGPMLKAERRAATTGAVLGPGAKPLMDTEIDESALITDVESHWVCAVGPIVAVVAIVVAGLLGSGWQAAPSNASLQEIISAANSYDVLMWAGFGGSIVAAGFAITVTGLNLSPTVDAWLSGVKSMTLAVVILVLAWTIGELCKSYLQLGPWVLTQFRPAPEWIPTMTFVVAAIIALATGSSFSAMAIVMLVAAPMAWQHPEASEAVCYATVAAVLSGSVFGDHCSPISDTTIMSSMSAGADHVDHVRTQAPYAFVCAGLAIGLGYIPAGFGISPAWSLPVCALVVVALFWGIGKPVEVPGDSTGTH